MVDATQHGQPDEPFDFNQIFIGREQQMAEFERILREWKHIMSQSPLEDTFLMDIPSPQNKLPGLIVLLYGQGGFGKSTLLRRFHEIATHQNERPLSGKIDVWALIDWKAGLDERRRSFYNPTQRQSVDPSKYYQMLCSQFASRARKSPKDFHYYQQAVEDAEKAKKEVSKVLEMVKRGGKDLDNKVLEALLGAVATTINTSIPASKLAVENAVVKKGADALSQLTEEQIRHLYQHFRQNLDEKLSDYLAPAYKLGLALGKDLGALAKNIPFLIFFDTYEEIDEGDSLLRSVMGAAGPRVGWIIAGRDNLWSGPERMERSTVLEYGYKELVFINRSLSVNFNSEDVGAFTLSNTKEYFDQFCELFPCTPPLAKLGDDAIKRIWEITKGIPLATNIAAVLYSETGDLDKVTGKIEGKKKIIDGMVCRYLLHTHVDESERAKLYALAMLRHPVQRSVLATAIGLTSEEDREPNRFSKALSDLHYRYSFIFTKDGLILHHEVRLSLRLWLLERREQPDILALNERLAKAHEAALKNLETQRDYLTLKERIQDDQWVEGYLNLAEQQFWLDPVEGVRHLLPLMIAAAIYRRDLKKDATEIGVFFAGHLPARYHNWWEWGTDSLFHLRNPSHEELSGLEKLDGLLSLGQFKAPSPLNQYEELAAALWWRLGEAYQYDNSRKALECYEKAFSYFKYEDDLKKALAEVCCAIACQLCEEKSYIESMHFANRAIEVRPAYSWAYNLRGIAYDELGKYEQAIDDYTIALRLDPNDASAYFNRGVAYRDLDKYEQSIDDYTAALRLDPNYASAYFNRGWAYNKLDKYEQAIDDYTIALRLDPNDASAYFNRAYGYLRLENVEKARLDFMEISKINPDGIDAALMIVFVSIEKESPGVELAERLETIAALDPQSLSAYICLAIALGLRGKLKDGLEKLELALQKQSDSEDALFWKGILSAYYYQRRPQIAIEAIEKALTCKLPPVLLKPLYWLERDRPEFFTEYAKPLLEHYKVE